MFEVNDELDLIVLTSIGPEQRSAVVIDNFYKNPDEIRQLCLNSTQVTFQDDPAMIGGLPGNRVYIETEEVTNKLKTTFRQLCSELPIWKHKFDDEVFNKVWNWKNSGFVCNVVNDKTLLEHPRGIIPHQDYYRQESPVEEKTQFGCVIYLNTPEECKGGTNLYNAIEEKCLFLKAIQMSCIIEKVKKIFPKTICLDIFGLNLIRQQIGK